MTIQFRTANGFHDSGDCSKNLNLLGHCQLIELETGSECGGHGHCGRDLVQLKNEDFHFVNPPTGIEKTHLTPNELSRGVRLACQTFPNEDGHSFIVTIL